MSLTRSEAVLELGRKLVAQLDSDNDLLASWLSHYIAELIDEAAKAPPQAKPAAQAACAKAVLELWSHRSSFPSHLRPFGQLEPVQRTLASLDVNENDFRYHPTVLREAAAADASEDVKQWLDLAIGLDYSARILIQSVLHTAARRAASASESEQWAELARLAGGDTGPDTAITTFAHADKGLAGDRDTTALLDILSRLEAFGALAKEASQDIRAQLGLGIVAENADEQDSAGAPG